MLLHAQERIEVTDQGYAKQKILLGTHTSEEEQNHVLIAEVQLPLEDSEVDQSKYDEERGEVGGYAASPGDTHAFSSCLIAISLLLTVFACMQPPSGHIVFACRA